MPDRPRRFVITGGPNVGKEPVFAVLATRGYPASDSETARGIYRRFKERLGRHLEVGDRREYSDAVLSAFIAEYSAHKHGIYFYNRGIPDGYGLDAAFGLGATQQLHDATRAYRYDAVFVLDPLESLADESDIVWASDREAARVHQLLIQGYLDAGYSPIFVPVDSPPHRVDFILRNLPED